MSVFWIRRRNFILSSLLGILLGVVIITSAIYFFRTQIKVLVRGEEKVETYEALALNKVLEKGTIVKEEDLIQISSKLPIEGVPAKEDIVGRKLLIDFHDNIPISKDIVEAQRAYGDDYRLYEFSFLKLPKKIEIGDFVDIRIRFHTGEDYLVASKKEIFALDSSSLEGGIDTLEIPLNENELLSVSSAYVDTILNPLCEVYVDKYIQAHSQEEGIINYPLNESVGLLFKDNPNILKDGNIEKNIKNRTNLLANMGKVVIENKRLINYNGLESNK